MESIEQGLSFASNLVNGTLNSVTGALLIVMTFHKECS